MKKRQVKLIAETITEKGLPDHYKSLFLFIKTSFMKKLLYILLGLFALYVILALFGPSEVKVERQISIAVPKSILMPKLADLQYFHNTWSPWTLLDPAMKCSYHGEAGKAGHSMNWSGNDEVGTGTLEITGVGIDTIYQKLSFEGMGDAKVYIIVSDSGAFSNLSWGLMFPVGFFGRTPMLFMNMEKQLGKSYEQGLALLKQAAEKEPAPVSSYDIQLKDWEKAVYLGKRATVRFQDMDSFFEKSYKELGLILEKENLKVSSPASAIYFTYDEVKQQTEMACVFRIEEEKQIKGWELFSFPAGKTLFLQYKGDPSKSAEAHQAMDTFMQKNGFKFMSVIEEYALWPEKGQDASNAVTNIYYLLK